MDFKRVQSSPLRSPNGRTNPLIQPLINISKASTPVRTRIVANTGPMNSTPVNVNKIPQKTPMVPQPSYNSLQQGYNKENDSQNIRYGSTTPIQPKQLPFEINSIGVSGGRKNLMGRDLKQIKEVAKGSFIVNQKKIQGRANLSPVLALNRKLKEGPYAEQNSRQFEQSPNRIIVKSRSKMTLFAEENTNKTSQNQEYYQFGHSHSKRNVQLVSSKQKNAQTTNIRTSNSFKTLLESKQKTPPRLGSMAFNSLHKKQTSNGSNQSLRSSLSTTNIIAGVIGSKGSERKLIESRSQERLTLIKSPKRTEEFPLCRNQDGNKAKYKVVGVDGQLDDDGQMLAYCVECSRAVVQNGFKMEEISRQDASMLLSQQSTGCKRMASPAQSRPVSPLHVTIDQAHRLKVSLLFKFQELDKESRTYNEYFSSELNKVDSFYNSVIELIEQQRVADRDAIISMRDRNKNQIKTYERDLNDSLLRVQQFLQILEGDMGSKQFRNTISIKNQLNQHQNILNKDIHYPPIVQVINGDIQDQFDNFAETFYHQTRLIINENRQHSVKQRHNSAAPFINRQNSNQFQVQNQPMSNSKQNPLRFSFEKMQGKRKSTFHPSMNTLTEQNEESIEDDQSFGQRNKQPQQNAKFNYENGPDSEKTKQPFRDIFEEEEEHENSHNGKPIISPTFKQF